MNKNYTFILVFHFLTLTLFGQRGYIFKDSTIIAGIFLKGGNEIVNSKICRVYIGKKILDYTPMEVKEYGFDDGRVYVSKVIQIADTSERVYLQRLYYGKTSVFYYKNKNTERFFIEKDSNDLIEIPMQDKDGGGYKSQLANILDDCNIISKAMKYVSYKKKPMTKLISSYNDCTLKTFPHFRFGLILGYGFNKLIPPIKNVNKLIYTTDYNYVGGFTSGIFIDKPLFLSNFSLHGEVLFSKNNFAQSTKIVNTDVDLVVNTTTVHIPILLRYTYFSEYLMPTMSIGLNYSHHPRNESIIYSATKTQNDIEINKLFNGTLITRDQIGFSAGTGMEYKLNFRHSLFFDIRYNSLFSISDIKSKSNSKYFRNSEIYLLIGINI